MHERTLDGFSFYLTVSSDYRSTHIKIVFSKSRTIICPFRNSRWANAWVYGDQKGTLCFAFGFWIANPKDAMIPNCTQNCQRIQSKVQIAEWFKLETAKILDRQTMK